MSHRKDDMAYGQYYGQGPERAEEEGSSRSLVGDTFNMLKKTYKTHSSSHQSGPQSSTPHYQGNPGSYGQNPAYQESGSQGKPAVGGLFGKLQGAVAGIGADVAQRLGTAIDPQGYAEYGVKPQSQQGQQQGQQQHRFGSFAPNRHGNDVKWHVDGCSYFFAVSQALESARESIWILDWWLSPELYLRRPPAKNEQYRLDRMLQAAAQRGVKINIIVYKEVTQALTLSSHHTKHHLEDLHQNIAVFRHPDHLPDRQGLAASITSSLGNLSLNALNLAKMSQDTMKGIYGMSDDMILYWAHHEKLCVIDGSVAFMGGLDMCFGRWDTNQHALSDVHDNPSDIIFPGQDYNNARVYDFHDVAQPDQNKLDRTKTSRMGWSDISVSLHGQVVQDLRKMFVERWNFIYDTKYQSRNDPRFSRLALTGQPAINSGRPHQQGPHQQAPNAPAPYQPGPHQQPPNQPAHQPGSYQSKPYQSGSYQPGSYQPESHQQQYRPEPHQQQYQPEQQHSSHHQYQEAPGSQHSQTYSYTGQSFPPPPAHGAPSTQGYEQSHSHSQNQSQAPYFPPPPPSSEQSYGQSRGVASDYYEEENEPYGRERGPGSKPGSGLVPRRFRDNFDNLRGELAGQIHQYQDRFTGSGPGRPQSRGNMNCQILRSCSKWSNGTATEHSIQDAYIQVIKNSEHFIYIENQFFITATSDAQKPVKNKIGAAIVERILRAARAGQKYKVIVVIPTVPCFAGDLQDEAALGTRAIMEFQYNSINRGGNSIMELIAKEGYNPMEYIRFYNLRNYDRIKYTPPASQGHMESSSHPPSHHRPAFDTSAPYHPHQPAPVQKSSSGKWDSVSACYMLNGPDLRNVPWDGPSEAEIDAYVTEELYVHSKVMIADDRIVICGSANLNDRSQLGEHDSEIAVIIEDTTPVQSTMNGQPWTASRFAASLRRHLFQKHLGLLPPQNIERPLDERFDFEGPESRIVADPLADTFHSLWNTRAHTNTEVFREVFHVVPDDSVRSWAVYKEFYGYYFKNADKQAYGEAKDAPPSPYKYGHVVQEKFPGPEGLARVKELLSQVKGTLVEMPLMFLIEEDVAESGLTLNELTEPLYT